MLHGIDIIPSLVPTTINPVMFISLKIPSDKKALRRRAAFQPEASAL